jgi:hypothetical protein
MLVVRSVSQPFSLSERTSSVRRAERRLVMAAPTMEGRAVSPLARDRRCVSESAALEFFVFADNGGDYHWAIVGGSGKSLAQSGSFGSYEEAAHAGRYVRDGAESARFERRAAEDRVVDVPNRREAAVSDDLDVERWLDEGGSFRS